MQEQHQIESFFDWLREVSKEDKEPLEKENVYGKVFALNEKPPTFGLKLTRIYAHGTLSVWDDALVFLAKPPKGPGRVLAKEFVSELASRATIGLSGLATTAIGAIFGRTNHQEALEMILNEYSTFIPLLSITQIEGGKGLKGFFFGQSLGIRYRDFSGTEVRAFFCSPKLTFHAWYLRRNIEKAIAAGKSTS